jgi:hypothetical protein
MSQTLSWSKRFVLAGFLFFVAKGLLWLIVLATLAIAVRAERWKSSPPWSVFAERLGLQSDKRSSS